MLQRRLTPPTYRSVVLAAILTMSACAGIDGTERGAIRENVIEPGITAIAESRSETCGVNAATLRTALEAYELLEGEPAPDEAALVAEDYLREEMPDWDVVDGLVVAQNPTCGPVPDAVPGTVVDIVTEPESGTRAVDDVYATFTVEDVASMGGPDCAKQFAVIVAGANRFVDDRGVEPESLDELDADGFLAEPVTMWQIVDDILRPANRSTCLDFVAVREAAELTQRCRIAARTIDVAREAYLASVDDAGEPSQQELVDTGMLFDADDQLVLLNGVITPVIGGDCENVDLFPDDPDR